MKIATRSANLALLALIAAGLLAVPPEKSQAQEPNFAWITDTNGITWREKIHDEEIAFEKAEKPQIAEIVVPEHARVSEIDVRGCINLTNLVIKPKQGTKQGTYSHDWLYIYGYGSGLRNITAPRTMINGISLGSPVVGPWDEPQRINAWSLAIQWTELEPEPPRIEIKTHSTANGKEMEIVWGDGTLQIADAVNGEYRDHLGSSPLRFPLAAAKNKQFFRIARIESPTTEEPPTPQTSGGGR